MKLRNKAWLPDNAHQEEEIANELLEYAKKEPSYSLRPFTLAKDIDSHSFDEWIQNDYEGFLPNCAFLADMAIKKRIEDNEQPFFEFCWKDLKGHCFKELHKLNCLTDTWEIRLEQLS